MRIIFYKHANGDWYCKFDETGIRGSLPQSVQDKLETIYVTEITDKEIIIDTLISFDVYPGNIGICNYRIEDEHEQIHFTHSLELTANEEAEIATL